MQVLDTAGLDGGRGARAGGRVLVPVDGSPAASRALPVAAALAGRADTLVDVVSVIAPGDDGASRRSDVEQALRRLGTAAGHGHLSRAADPAAAIATLAASPGGGCPAPLVCLTSHGHSRLSTVPIGAVAAGVMARTTRPVLVVGPLAAPGYPDAPVVALLGGRPGAAAEDRATARHAIRLARTLDVPLQLVVALGDADAGAPARRAAEERLDDLVASARAKGGDVSGRLVEDPSSPVAGLCHLLRSRPAQLVVASQQRPGSLPCCADPVLHLLHQCPVPVAVCPS